MNSNDFYNSIDYRILKLIDKCNDFYNLMKYAKGIHPIDILNSLERLKNSKEITTIKYKKIIKSAQDRGKVAPDNTTNYRPVPHLLDYDWRFSKSGILAFSKIIKKFINNEKQSIVFMGTPSLFIYFANHYPNLCRYILVDKNAIEHEKQVDIKYAIEFYNCDISKVDDLNLSADIVVMDPPWYLEHNKMFISAGAKFCKKNTSMMFCVTPPFLTRPSANDEYYELCDFVEGLDFSIAKYKETCIRYATPPFEKYALEANGILCLPNDWRAGDLLIMRKSTNAYKSNVPIFKIPESTSWAEISIGPVRIRYKNPQSDAINNFGIHLISIYDNDIYPSVSRRFSGSNQINVWTSGNHVFQCTDMVLFQYILCNWDSRGRIASMIEKKYNVNLDNEQYTALINSINQLDTIIIHEIKNYGRWI